MSAYSELMLSISRFTLAKLGRCSRFGIARTVPFTSSREWEGIMEICGVGGSELRTEERT
jgi:hypothetical protein